MLTLIRAVLYSADRRSFGALPGTRVPYPPGIKRGTDNDREREGRERERDEM